MRAASWLSATSVAGDVALAVGLVVGAQVELWLDGSRTPLLALATLVGTTPLALRRRFPLGVLVVVVSALTALTVAGEDFIPYAQLLGMLIASYTVAAHETALPAWAGLVIAGAAGVANSIGTADRVQVGDVVFPLVLLGGPWLAGRALRLWRGRTAQLQRLTEELAHEREERAALAVAAERARIARELHDVLTQSMNVIVINAEGAQEALAHDPTLAYRPLAKIQETGRAALRETRRMLGMLRAPEEPDALAPLPGLADLAALVEGVSGAGPAVRLRVEGPAGSLPPALELSAYRIVQQALTNTLTHARARTVDVVLRYAPDCLELDVLDDGRGDGESTAGSGFGLVGMRERAALFGGTLTAGPRPEGGFGVHARLPVEGTAG
jgi:signal transduction histidine kinase